MNSLEPLLKEDKFGDVTNASDADILRKTVVHKILTPYYYSEIKSNLNSRQHWANAGNFFDITNKLIFISGSAISFASATYSDRKLAFIAGSAGILASATLALSSFCFKKCHDKTRVLNNMLTKLNIAEIPDIVVENENQPVDLNVKNNVSS